MTMFDTEADGAWDNDESIFDDHEEDTSNPGISAEEDRLEHSPPVHAGNVPVALVAVFDEYGAPKVARTVMENGKPKQLEDFRQPTADEYNSVMFNAKIVRGGVVGTNVPTSTNLSTAMQKAPLGYVPPKPPWKKVATVAGVGIALAGVGYGLYRWKNGSPKKGKRK